MVSKPCDKTGDDEGQNVRWWPQGDKRDRWQRQEGTDPIWQMTGYKK